MHDALLNSMLLVQAKSNSREPLAKLCERATFADSAAHVIRLVLIDTHGDRSPRLTLKAGRIGLEDRRAPTIKLDEEQAIAVRELDPTAHLALQYNKLLPQRGVLCFKSALGLEGRGNQVQEEEYQRDHCRRR
jgi:hypothetical protein